jgi:hypothetical protein
MSFRNHWKPSDHGKAREDNEALQKKLDDVNKKAEDARLGGTLSRQLDYEGGIYVGQGFINTHPYHIDLTPQDDHCCHSCNSKLRSKGRFRKTIGNPLCDTLVQLAKFAVRQPQKHDSYLFTETL